MPNRKDGLIRQEHPGGGREIPYGGVGQIQKKKGRAASSLEETETGGLLDGPTIQLSMAKK